MKKTHRKLADQSKASFQKSPVNAAGGGIQRWLLVVALLVSAAGTWAFMEYVVWAKIPSQLVGKWVVEGGKQDGATLDFFRDGSMVGRMNHEGMEARINARVRLDGEKLYVTSTNPNTKSDETKIQIIRTLTASRLEIEDEQGNIWRMSRAE